MVSLPDLQGQWDRSGSTPRMLRFRLSQVEAQSAIFDRFAQVRVHGPVLRTDSGLQVFHSGLRVSEYPLRGRVAVLGPESPLCRVRPVPCRAPWAPRKSDRNVTPISLYTTVIMMFHGAWQLQPLAHKFKQNLPGTPEF